MRQKKKMKLTKAPIANSEMLIRKPVEEVFEAFINPEIIEFSGKRFSYEEGCLSIPGIHEDVVREEKILIWYQDENLIEHEEYFDGMNARVIQHEYDHLFGKLFIDKISPLKKKLLKRRLNDIINGTADVDYPMKFFGKAKAK